MIQNDLRVFFVKDRLELAIRVTLVTPFLDTLIRQNVAVLKRHKVHRALDRDVLFKSHAFRFFCTRGSHVVLNMTGTDILRIHDLHVAHDQVLVFIICIAAFIAGAEEDVAALVRLNDLVNLLDVAARHEAVGRSFVVRFRKRTLFVFIQLVTDRDNGQAAGST